MLQVDMYMNYNIIYVYIIVCIIRQNLFNCVPTSG